MIGSTRSLSVFAYGQPVDMRRSFDGLSCLVSESLSLDPLSGDLFLFVSRNRKRAKVLFWDGTGFCVYGKRLERGRFTAVWLRPEETELAGRAAASRVANGGAGEVAPSERLRSSATGLIS